MNKFVCLVLPFMVYLLSNMNAFSQELPAELRANPLYSHQSDIINGVKWVYEMKYRGSPFLSEKYWPAANVRYNGEEFNNVRLNYNLFTDDFIVYVPLKGNEKYVLPVKDYLEGFSYTDSITRIYRHFEYFQLPGTRGKKLYEISYRGDSILYLIRHQVSTRSDIHGGFLGDYIRWVELVIKYENNFTSFKNKHALLKLLGKHPKELRKFIRKNGLKINKKHYDDVVPVIRYFEQLEKEDKEKAELPGDSIGSDIVPSATSSGLSMVQKGLDFREGGQSQIIN